jgi:hypothetical protein
MQQITGQRLGSQHQAMKSIPAKPSFQSEK